MKQAKSKKTQAIHTPKSPKGMGDHYGSGIRNKVARIVDMPGINPAKPGKLKKAPKALA